MPRTVVPPRRSASRAQGSEPDDLPEKIAKYVPAETLALFVPATAALGTGHDSWLVATFVVAALGTPAYLWYSARNLTVDERPLIHFYVLSVVAFGCWAIATSSAVLSLIDRELFDIDQVVAGVILLLGTFTIPLADGILNVLSGRNS